MADALPTCLLDGVLMPAGEARISPFDRGFLFGDGIYEVVPCYDGKPFRLQAHFDRMQAGLDALGIPNPYSRTRWEELIHELIAANDAGDMGLYIEITRGTDQGRDFLPSSGMKPTVFGFCWRLAATQFEKLERGIVGVTLEDIRWQRCDIKSVALLGAVMLRMEAKRRGADEAILLRDGRLAEGSSCAVVCRQRWTRRYSTREPRAPSEHYSLGHRRSARRAGTTAGTARSACGRTVCRGRNLDRERDARSDAAHDAR